MSFTFTVFAGCASASAGDSIDAAITARAFLIHPPEWSGTTSPTTGRKSGYCNVRGTILQDTDRLRMYTTARRFTRRGAM